MQLFTVVAATVIVVIGVFVNHFTPLQNEPDSKVVEEISSGETTNSPTQTGTPTPTISPTLPPTQSPTPEETSSDFILNSYRYPNSNVVSSGFNTFSLQSFDSADAITVWYKDKLKQENMSIETYVVTKANGSVNNKLVSASTNQKLEVSIVQENQSSPVTIEVHVD